MTKQEIFDIIKPHVDKISSKDYSLAEVLLDQAFHYLKNLPEEEQEDLLLVKNNPYGIYNNYDNSTDLYQFDSIEDSIEALILYGAEESNNNPVKGITDFMCRFHEKHNTELEEIQNKVDISTEPFMDHYTIETEKETVVVNNIEEVNRKIEENPNSIVKNSKNQVISKARFVKKQDMADGYNLPITNLYKNPTDSRPTRVIQGKVYIHSNTMIAGKYPIVKTKELIGEDQTFIMGWVKKIDLLRAK